jgi:hypothetical protein
MEFIATHKNNIFSASLATVLILLTMVFASSCNKEVKSQTEPHNDSLALARKDSVLKEKEQDAAKLFPRVNYSLVRLKSAAHLYSLLNMKGTSKDSADRKRIIATLNRKELRFIGAGTSIIVPDTFVADVRAYSVFPQFYKGAAEIPKIIMVSNRYQSYACYEYGNLVRFAAANTGKERTPSYPGRYSLVWREYLRESSVNSKWKLPFTFNFHNEAGSAFHQFDMPGRPVSHSCIRQFMEDAKWLFKWGKGCKIDTTTHRFIPFTGTPVVIVDYYDFNLKHGLWLDLASNKDSVMQLPPDPMAVEEALIPICQIPKDSRGVLVNKQRYIYAEDTLRARGVIRPNIQLAPSVDFNKLRAQKEAAKARKLKEDQIKASQQFMHN